MNTKVVAVSLTILSAVFTAEVYAANVAEVEPNNVNAPQLVTVNDVVTGSLKATGSTLDKDWYQFVPPADGKVSLTITSPTYDVGIRFVDANYGYVTATDVHTGNIIGGAGARVSNGGTSWILDSKTVKTTKGTLYLYIEYGNSDLNGNAANKLLEQPYTFSFTDNAGSKALNPPMEMTIEKEGMYTIDFLDGTGSGEVYVNDSLRGDFTSGQQYIIGTLNIGDKLRLTMNGEEAEDIAQIDYQSWDVYYSGGSVVLHVEDPVFFTQADLDAEYTLGFNAGQAACPAAPPAPVCSVTQADVDAAAQQGFTRGMTIGAASRQAEVDALNASNATLTSDLSAANTQIASLQSQLATLQAQLTAANNEITKLNAANPAGLTSSVKKFMVNNASQNSTMDLSFGLPANLNITTGMKTIKVLVKGADGKVVAVQGNATVTLSQNGKLLK